MHFNAINYLGAVDSLFAGMFINSQPTVMLLRQINAEGKIQLETLRAGWDVARYKVMQAEASRELSDFL